MHANNSPSILVCNLFIYVIAPVVLTFHLKRFNKYMEKVNRPITYPEMLDMGKYMSGYMDDNKRKESCAYKLFAVVVHRGSDLHSGHYYSYVRGMDDNWYVANDEIVKSVPVSKPLQESAYVLFYQKLNVSVKKPSQPEVPASQPLQKSVNELHKERKLMMDGLMKTKIAGKSAENQAPQLSADEKTPSTDAKSTSGEEEQCGAKSREKAVQLHGSKRIQMLRMLHMGTGKKAKTEEVEIKQKYFNTDAVIQAWDRKKPSEERMQIMKEEAREERPRTKNTHDLEYDRGKVKKVKEKNKRKYHDGIRKQLDRVEEERKMFSVNAN